MGTTRAAVVAAARSWIGTPFLHQGRAKGLGCDCGGHVGCVAVESGCADAEWWRHEFDPLFSGYGPHPVGDRLRAICARFMTAIEVARPGDVLLMHFGSGEPQHLGIAADYRHGGLSVVHALSVVGRVLEHRLAPPWSGRIVAAFALPGVG
jgi:cell wall-associated NlpC family hydrolase